MVPVANDENSDAYQPHQLADLGARLRQQTRAFRAAKEPENLDEIVAILDAADDDLDALGGEQGAPLLLTKVWEIVLLVADLQRSWDAHRHVLQQHTTSFESEIAPSLDRVRDSTTVLAQGLAELADALRSPVGS